MNVTWSGEGNVEGGHWDKSIVYKVSSEVVLHK